MNHSSEKRSIGGMRKCYLIIVLSNCYHFCRQILGLWSLTKKRCRQTRPERSHVGPNPAEKLRAQLEQRRRLKEQEQLEEQRQREGQGQHELQHDEDDQNINSADDSDDNDDDDDSGEMAIIDH